MHINYKIRMNVLCEMLIVKLSDRNICNTKKLDSYLAVMAEWSMTLL